MILKILFSILLTFKSCLGRVAWPYFPQPHQYNRTRNKWSVSTQRLVLHLNDITSDQYTTTMQQYYFWRIFLSASLILGR